MDPNIFGSNFIDRLCSTIYQFIDGFLFDKDLYENEQQSYFSQISTILILIFDILIVSLSMPNVEYDKNILIKTIKIISLVIGKYPNKNLFFGKVVNNNIKMPVINDISAYSDISLKTLNISFAYFINFLTPKFLTYNDVDSIIFYHINLLTQLKKRSTKRSLFANLQFSFLNPFAKNEMYILHLAHSLKGQITVDIFPYNRTLSQIIFAFYQTIYLKDNYRELPLETAINFFLSITKTFSNSPSYISKEIAFMLFPLIDIMCSSYDSCFINLNRIKLKIIPIIIFILSNSVTKQLQNYFKSIVSSYRLHYLKLFQSMIITLFEELKSIKPTYENPCFYLNFFSVFTRKLIIILNLWFSYYDENTINQVVLIIKSLYNEYQDIENMPLFYAFCSDLISKYPCSRELISWALSLCSFNSHKTRCFATAILIHIFKNDFIQTKTVITSSVEMTDSLTTNLFDLDINKIDIYNTLLDKIVNITKVLYFEQYPLFYRLLNERIKQQK